MKFAFLFLFLSIPVWAKWSVSTYNIRNFDRDPGAGQTDVVALGKIIKNLRSDVFSFQEVVNTSAFDSLIKTYLPRYQYKISSCGGFGKQKLAIVYNPSTFDYVKHSEDLSFSDVSGKCGSLRPVFLVTLREKASKKLYTFGAVHLKAGGATRAMERRWKQYIQLEKLSALFTQSELVLLGDFNTTGYSIRNEDFSKFENFLSSSELHTVSEELNCTDYWTGLQGGPLHQPSVLDHIVIKSETHAKVLSVTVGGHCAKVNCRPATPKDLGPIYQSVSDHCPVQVTFK